MNNCKAWAKQPVAVMGPQIFPFSAKFQITLLLQLQGLSYEQNPLCWSGGCFCHQHLETPEAFGLSGLTSLSDIILTLEKSNISKPCSLCPRWTGTQLHAAETVKVKVP